jgi:hypothetical protein
MIKEKPSFSSGTTQTPSRWIKDKSKSFKYDSFINQKDAVIIKKINNHINMKEIIDLKKIRIMKKNKKI